MEIPQSFLDKAMSLCETFDAGEYTLEIKFKIIKIEEGKPVEIQVKESKEKNGWFMGNYHFFIFQGIGIVSKKVLIEFVKEKYKSREFTTDPTEAGKLYRDGEQIFALADQQLIKTILEH